MEVTSEQWLRARRKIVQYLPEISPIFPAQPIISSTMTMFFPAT